MENCAEHGNSHSPVLELVTGEPRLGKSFTSLSQLPPGSALLWVGLNVGDASGEGALLSTAADVQRKITDDLPHLRPVQLHGIAWCPRVREWLNRQREVGASPSAQAISAFHRRNCGGTTKPVAVKWLDAPISLEDYDLIAQEGHCPIRVAEQRALNLRPGDVIITTYQKLRLVATDVAVAASERGVPFEVVVDECHRLDGPAVGASLTLKISGRVDAHWLFDDNSLDPLPQGLNAEDAREVCELLWNAVEPALRCLPHYVSACTDLWSLSRLEATAARGALRDLRIPFSNEFRGRFPTFIQEVLSRQSGQVDEAQFLADLVRGHGSRYQVTEIVRHRLMWRDEVPPLSSYFQGLGAQPTKDRSLARRLARFLDGVGEDELEGDVEPSARAWAPPCELVLDLLRSDGLLVCIPRYDLNRPRVVRALDFHVLDAEVDSFGVSRLRFSVLRLLANYATRISLLSATPPWPQFWEQAGFRVVTKRVSTARAPPRMVIVCERRNRPIRALTQRAGGDANAAEAYLQLIRQVVSRSSEQVHVFARSREDHDLVQPVLPAGCFASWARSRASTGVQLAPGLVLLTGPPVQPPDEEVARKYGRILPRDRPMLTYEASAQIRLLTAIMEAVQPLYRACASGEQGRAIILGCSDAFIHGLRTALQEWGFREVEVVVVTPGGPGGLEALVTRLLEAAGVDDVSLDVLLIPQMGERLRQEGPTPARTIEREWVSIGRTQAERRRAVRRGLELGMFVRVGRNVVSARVA